MRRLIGILALLLTAPVAAQEQPLLTLIDGQKLHTFCEYLADPSASAQLGGLGCRAYVAGVVDSIFNEGEPPPIWEGRSVCIPKGVTVNTLSDVVLKFLTENPEIRHLSGYMIVRFAVTLAYPC